jgi:ESF2/ABP1 family protein
METEEEYQNSPENDDEDLSDEALEDEEMEKSKSRKKPGIIYLSSIPSGMNPQLVREFLGVHGEIGKSFLQPIESMLKLLSLFYLMK